MASWGGDRAGGPASSFSGRRLIASLDRFAWVFIAAGILGMVVSFVWWAFS